MSKVIYHDFRKVAPETSARAPLDERGDSGWRQEQRTKPSAVFEALS